MAISSSDRVKAVIFLLVSALLLVIIIFSLVGTQWMKAKDQYYIEFGEGQGGLSTGASVRFHGIKVGKVVRMDMDLERQMGCITVEVEKNTPVKTDSTATIEVESFVTGTRFLQISAGSVEAGLLPPNDPGFKIPCYKSAFQKFSGNIVNLGAQAPILATNLTAMFSRPNAEAVGLIVQEQVPALLNHVNAFFASQNAQMVSSILCRVDGIIATNSQVFGEALRGFNTSMQAMQGILEENREVTRRLLDNLESASRQADGLLQENRGAVSNALAQAAGGLKEAREVINDSRGSLGESLESLNRSSALMEQFLEKINRKPSLLLYGGEDDNEEWTNE